MATSWWRYIHCTCKPYLYDVTKSRAPSFRGKRRSLMRAARDCAYTLSAFSVASIHEPKNDLLLPLNEGVFQLVTSMHKIYWYVIRAASLISAQPWVKASREHNQKNIHSLPLILMGILWRTTKFQVNMCSNTHLHERFNLTNGYLLHIGIIWTTVLPALPSTLSVTSATSEAKLMSSLLRFLQCAFTIWCMLGVVGDIVTEVGGGWLFGSLYELLLLFIQQCKFWTILPDGSHKNSKIITMIHKQTTPHLVVNRQFIKISENSTQYRI